MSSRNFTRKRDARTTLKINLLRIEEALFFTLYAAAQRFGESIDDNDDDEKDISASISPEVQRQPRGPSRELLRIFADYEDTSAYAKFLRVPPLRLLVWCQ